MKVPHQKKQQSFPTFQNKKNPDLLLSSPQTQQLDPEEAADGNLLSVRKPTVGRTHSLPNDSYMFLPPQPVGLTEQAQPVAQAQGPQHIESSHREQSGTSAGDPSPLEGCRCV